MIRTLKRLVTELPIACHLEHSAEHCLLARCDACPTWLFDIQKNQLQKYSKIQSNLAQPSALSSQFLGHSSSQSCSSHNKSNDHDNRNHKGVPRSRDLP